MRTRVFCSRQKMEQGSVLFGALALLFIVIIAVAGLLSAVQQEMRITDRAVTWKTALPVAEAGIEEAMAHLNSGAPRATNGWVLNTSTGTFQKQRHFGGAFFQAEITQTEPPMIRSRGFVPAQPHTNFLNRAVEVTTTTSGLAGIIVKDTISCGSGGVVDSYNSSDPNFSTPQGQYDPAKAKDTVLVASITNRVSCVDVGSRQVFGYAATGTGGTVLVGSNGRVGSREWVLRADSGGKIEPGHYIPNFTRDFPEIVNPIKNGMSPIKDVGGYAYTFLTGDYEMDKLSIGPKDTAIVTGRARLLVKGDLTLQGLIFIKPGASLELYCAHTVKITGQGFINENGRARFLKIFGMGIGQNGDVSLQGGTDFIGQIYAPHANVKVTGSCRFFGQVKAYSADLGGATEFHADEDDSESKYKLASWKEIP